MNSDSQVNFELLNASLKENSPQFFDMMKAFSWKSNSLSDLIALNTLRKKHYSNLKLNQSSNNQKIKVAFLSGYTLFPIQEIVEHLLNLDTINVNILLGDYDNYVSEILDPSSKFNAFSPQIVILFPSFERCKYTGNITDCLDAVEKEADQHSKEVLDLCETIFQRHKSNIILGNFPLPNLNDLGPLKAKLPASLWNFRKFVNLKIALNSPFFLHFCDIEFLTSCHGLNRSWNNKQWLETKQPFHSQVLLKISKEISLIIIKLFRSPKKVLVVDADNTLWGGVVGDDGIEGIELGDSSSRGEGFKRFQDYILSLKDRGVLIALCSKNEEQVVKETILNHPEMVLKLDNFSSLKVNWNPKSDNILDIANELNLGLDSFVFVDDNPAEVEIVNQHCKEVTCICLGQDPSKFVELIDAERIFEPSSITEEDLKRNNLYTLEKHRESLRSSVASYDAYLQSLNMSVVIRKFSKNDVPRIAQLINKSNQFNLTTVRRNETEVFKILDIDDHYGFTCRLKDKFSDHGLISVIILRIKKKILFIDTWLMSCRVLSRQLEEEVMNKIVGVAKNFKLKEIVGDYKPTKKNSLVKDWLTRMGMQEYGVTKKSKRYILTVDNFKPFKTSIKISINEK